MYLGDENVSNSKNGSIENDFSAWTNELLDLLEHPENLKLGCKCSGKKQVEFKSHYSPLLTSLFFSTPL